jgi:hypothetical protein
MKRMTWSVMVLFGLGGCGGGNPAAPSGNGQQQPPPATNRAPAVSGVTVTPAFGIQDFTTFTFNVAATDPDGDALTYAWDIAGNPRSGQTTQMLFTNGGSGRAAVTVTDGKGGSGTGTVDFTVGTMTGVWNANLLSTDMRLTLTQGVAGIVTGTVSTVIGNGTAGPTGEPGKINGAGDVEIRVKVAPFTDFYFRGHMDGTGQRVVGSVTGSGFTGQSMVMTKQ